MDEKLGIEIKVFIDGYLIAEKDAFDFEGAEENLGKLRRDYEKKQAEAETETERKQEEVEELKEESQKE